MAARAGQLPDEALLALVARGDEDRLEELGYE